MLSLGLLLCLTAGCSSVKRHQSAAWKGQDNSLVDMELFGASLEYPGQNAADKNLWDLSASAQAGLIQILHERYPDNEQFIHALNNQYLAHRAGPLQDLNTKDLRMVFTISKHRDYKGLNKASSRFSQADRIEYLKFSLELPAACNMRFKKWNRFATEYGELEIADVSFSTSLDLEAEGVIRKSDAGGKLGFSKNEQQELNTRYLKLNGSIADQVICIEEEGTREIDLTGNVIADVSLEFEGFPERVTLPVFSGKGLSSLRFVDVLVPRIEEAFDTIQAMLTFEYVYRHVQSGSNTYAEWDDQVEYYTGEVSKQVPLFLKRDYLPGFYGIGEVQSGKDLLKIRQGGGRDYLLQFVSYSDAYRTLEWLEELTDASAEGMQKSLSIGNSTLLFKGKVLTGAEASEHSWKVQPVY